MPFLLLAPHRQPPCASLHPSSCSDTLPAQEGYGPGEESCSVYPSLYTLPGYKELSQNGLHAMSVGGAGSASHSLWCLH